MNASCLPFRSVSNPKRLETIPDNRESRFLTRRASPFQRSLLEPPLFSSIRGRKMEIPRAFHSSPLLFFSLTRHLRLFPSADRTKRGAFSFPLFLPNLRSRTDADSALATRRLPDVREGKLARLGDTGPGYLRVAFRIARICAHTRIRGAWRGQTESNGCKGALTLSHGVLLWPCRVKGTRKLARPSCYVKPKFSLGIGRRRYPLPTAGGRSAGGGERGERVLETRRF